MDNEQLTPQEIAAGMEKGAWTYERRDRDTAYLSILARDEYVMIEDAAAITTAVNATYGANINPIAIGGLVEAVTQAIDWCRAGMGVNPEFLVKALAAIRINTETEGNG